MTENDITVETHKLYRLKTYGDVRVLSIYRQIEEANADGVIDEPLIVRFDNHPYEASEYHSVQEAEEMRQTRVLEIGEFIDDVMEVKPDSEQPRIALDR